MENGMCLNGPHKNSVPGLGPSTLDRKSHRPPFGSTSEISGGPTHPRIAK